MVMGIWCGAALQLGAPFLHSYKCILGLMMHWGRGSHYSIRREIVCEPRGALEVHRLLGVVFLCGVPEQCCSRTVPPSLPPIFLHMVIIIIIIIIIIKGRKGLQVILYNGCKVLAQEFGLFNTRCELYLPILSEALQCWVQGGKWALKLHSIKQSSQTLIHLPSRMRHCNWCILYKLFKLCKSAGLAVHVQYSFNRPFLLPLCLVATRAFSSRLSAKQAFWGREGGRVEEGWNHLFVFLAGKALSRYA